MVSQGEIRDEFASSVDIYPTILDMAGVDKAGADVHGRSLLPLIRGDQTAWRDAVVTEFLGLGNIGTCMKTIRVGNLKYGYNLTFRDELYDLARDPFEMHNLINDPGYAEDVEELKDRLEQWMAVTSDPALRMYRWHRKKSPER